MPPLIEQPKAKGEYPDLVSFRVTNPVAYLKLWWKKVMAGEGVDFRFRIHPITAVLMVLAIAVVGFGLGRITLLSYIPIVKNVIPTPTPTPSDWRDTTPKPII